MALDAKNQAFGGGTLLAALAGALIGGLLLNIMPCVFPILSLKALSLAKIGGDEARARQEALAYAAGAVLICVLLGGALLGLRSEEHTSELQSLMRTSYAVFCLKKKKTTNTLEMNSNYTQPQQTV